MKKNDIRETVDSYKKESTPEARYSSFDYCYNYFRTTDDYLADVEKSCLTLGFYLASWGMFRGSSFLLDKSLKHFVPAIKYLDTLDKSYWEIDVHTYTEENIDKIMDVYENLKERLMPEKKVSHTTLLTKTMLGVFGSIPAFDSYFCTAFREISKPTCGFRVVNKKSLSVIRDFYLQNKEEIDQLSASTFTKQFPTSKKSDVKHHQINYTRAKIIDMYGFSKIVNRKKDMK